MEDIYLSDYQPESELMVECHDISYPKFPVIDFHTHYGWGNKKYHLKTEMEFLDGLGVKGLVNLDGGWGERLDTAMKFFADYRDKIVIFGNLDFSGIDEKGYTSRLVNTLKESYKKGIKGLKVFKSLSLNLTDKNGKHIRADDKRLKPVWETAGELNIPVLIHIADPVAFFKRVDEKNEQFSQLRRNPHYQLYGHEFTFEQLMEMQHNLLAENPHTTFVVAHVGSYSENLGFVSRQLDEFPNMYIDVSARLDELGRQPYTARKFLMKYSDRILFGTDTAPTQAEFNTAYYKAFYRHLETYDEYFQYALTEFKGRWKIYGVGLPDDVLKKIYYENAVKLVPEFKKCLE